jgi:hypothetical protein
VHGIGRNARDLDEVLEHVLEAIALLGGEVVELGPAEGHDVLLGDTGHLGTPSAVPEWPA